MNSNGSAEATPVEPVPQLTWAQKLIPKKPEAGAKPKTQPVSILKKAAKSLAKGPESPRDVGTGGFATEINPPPPPPYPPQVPMPCNPIAAPKYPPPPPLHPPSHYLTPDSPMASSGPSMDSAVSGGAVDRMRVTGESFHTTHAPTSSGPGTESETSSPHRNPQSQFVDEASDDESFRSDSEEDVPDYWDGQFEDEETVISEHAKLQEVVAEMWLDRILSFVRNLFCAWHVLFQHSSRDTGTSRETCIASETSKVVWSLGRSALFPDPTSEVGDPKHNSSLIEVLRQLTLHRAFCFRGSKMDCPKKIQRVEEFSRG